MRLSAALAGLLLLAGCDDLRPDPPPVAEVVIQADGALRLDGRTVEYDALDRELTRRAADAPNPKLSRTRLHVRVRPAPGVPYERALELQERCLGLGISNVEIAR